ncbi:hypothetical protein BH09MYX1_BH09MYX1_65380 [soil metagenome]
MSRRALTLALPAVVSCGKCGSGSAKLDGAAPSATTTSVPPARSEEVLLDPLAHQETCSIGHEGILLDLGAPEMRPQLGYGDTGVEAVEREGATWERISTRSITFRFVAPPEGAQTVPGNDGGAKDLRIDARLHGLAAKSASVYLNGKAVGPLPFSKSETAIRSLKGDALLLPGVNELTLRFNGLAKQSTDAAVEIDWIRVGYGADSAYAAPTLAQAIATSSIGAVPRRALSLRAPGFLRCSGYFPGGATLRAALGVSGTGDADLELRVRDDRGVARSLGTFHLHGGPEATWKEVELPLGDTEFLGAIELAAIGTAPGTRVLFGEPKVVRPTAPKPARPTARGVVLVVFGQMPSRLLSIYGGPNALPELDALAKNAIVFESHRATSSWAGASFASMLTGLSPHLHGATDEGARLATSVTTIADAAKDAGVSTAYFTANPTTSSAFGMDRGFQTSASSLPGAPGGGAAVFDSAAKWIAEHKSDRFLVVVHARGGHAPWDIPIDDLKGLAPDGYTGAIEPIHAAEMLAKARHVPPLLRFNDADRTRAWALYGKAIQGQDAAFGRLLAGLRDVGREADTTVIVSGDAGMDDGAHIPFGDLEPLNDGALTIPLLVRPAGGQGSVRSQALTSSVDVARTMLLELGLAPPLSFGGLDLRDLASGQTGRIVEATFGSRRWLRWQSFVFRGADGKEELCDLKSDATCAVDMSETFPLVVEAFRREVLLRARKEAKRTNRDVREAPNVDPELANALGAWGRL